MTTILTDEEMLARAGTCADGDDGGSLPNVIMFGGATTNKYAAALAKIQPFETTTGPDGDAGNRSVVVGPYEHGFGIGPCRFGGGDVGYGLVSFGPVDARSREATAVTIAGTDAASFEAAVRLFRSRLFKLNMWQHRVPEFAVVEGTSGKFVGAGTWGEVWEYRADTSHLACW